MRKTIGAELEMTLHNAQRLLIFASAKAGNGIKITPRNQIVMGMASIAFEHQSSMIRLIATGNHDGTALALLRLVAEAVVKVLWIAECATDDQIDKIFKGTLKPLTFGRMTNALGEAANNDKYFGPPPGFWEMLNGFTHSGTEQLARRFTENGDFASSYSETELTGAITMGAICIGTIGSFICLFCGRESDSDQVTVLMTKLFPIGDHP